MNSYIPKPFKAWQLVHTIADVTGRGAAISYKQKPETRIDARGDNTVSDLAYLHEFCESDADRMKRYISLYLKAIPAFKEKIAIAVAQKDVTEIALHIHSFKPKWMMMGMKETSELATKIDQQCKDGSSDIYENVTTVLLQTDRSVIELADKC